MNVTTPKIAHTEQIEVVTQLIEMLPQEILEQEQFHNIMREISPNYFRPFSPEKDYEIGDKFTHLGGKFLVIANAPAGTITDPSLAIARNYCLAYNSLSRNLWAFKEPVVAGMQRYPYGSNDTYTAKHDADSSENTSPPDENPTLWELNVVSGI